MAGWNSSTSSCSSSSTSLCDSKLVESFEKIMGETVLRMNALQIGGAILAGLAVGIGAYGQRYRHRPFTRLLYLGASTLFLPIISYVVSMGTGFRDHIMQHSVQEGPFFYSSYYVESLVISKCLPLPMLVVIWAFLAQNLMINTSVVVSIDDNEGQNLVPPLELLVQGVWTLYLAVLYFTSFGSSAAADLPDKLQLRQQEEEETSISSHLSPPPPPPLLVTGEHIGQLEKKPCGYVFKDGCSGGLVTIDRVWKYEDDSMLPPRLKDLCLSFALFKLLRCRFARYKLTNAGSTGTLNFFWSLLTEDGEHDRVKVFSVIEDELRFLHDCYYSSLPISYSKCWLPILSVIISLLITLTDYPQFACYIQCTQGSKACMLQPKSFGNIIHFESVPVFLLIVLVMVADVRDMASYICSNWTKVSLIGHIVNSSNSSSQHSLRRHRWFRLLLRCRCKLLNNQWDDRMGQCSVLATGSPQRKSCFLVVLRHLLRLPEPQRKAKVPEAVKVCIIDALRSSSSSNGRRLSNGTSSLRRIQGGESFVWACNGQGTCDTILVWHIATFLFEVKDDTQHRRAPEHGSSPPTSSTSDDHKTAATHLSRYCAYLVARCPELLPDDGAWIKSLYKAVKKDADAARASARSSAAPEVDDDEYQKLVVLLSANAKHDVVKNGVRLGKQLVETALNSGEETAWKLLASFWSDMVLYVAPSDNLKGHSEAIARGGELITLLWALLFHAGIVSRPGGQEDGVAAPTSAGAV